MPARKISRAAARELRSSIPTRSASGLRYFDIDRQTNAAIATAVQRRAAGQRLVTIETWIDPAKSRYTFLVVDTGPGVLEGEVAVLFTPFFRSVGALSSDGYGLGLALARRSIEAHGGTIRAQHRPTGGLAVEIVLPLNGLANAPSSAP